MELDMQAPVLSMEAGQVLSLHDAAGTRILARTGIVWVTYEDSRSDLILQPGEAIVVAKGGRTVLQALQPACVALQ